METPHHWISVYNGKTSPYRTIDWDEKHFIVIEGIEGWLKNWCEKATISEVRNCWETFLDDWLKWEYEQELRKIILIGTDITKGIVPIAAKERKWRDVTGWIFQDTACKAERVDIVWYGINKQLK